MFTASGIKALRLRDKFYKVVDHGGMYVAVQPLGSVIFRYDYRINGRRETLALYRENHSDETRPIRSPRLTSTL